MDSEGDDEETREGLAEGVDVGVIGAIVGINSATLIAEMLDPLRE